MRCAVYTRRSVAEAEVKEFTTLDAQREACEAFILSRQHEGWAVLADRYDDNGFSGGGMERPALIRLLSDIAAGRVDLVIIYKIDRLTRSLFDFSKLANLFDKAGVSFVSVTQSFNTADSMGRLMLNVLLSFAQFEREITADRIRDKVAASKARGMWTGGHVPFGYRLENRKLIVIPEEAKVVRHLFARYLEIQDLATLAHECSRAGIMKRNRTLNSTNPKPDQPFSRADLRVLLSQPTYVGLIRLKDALYAGRHEPIVDLKTFDRAQAVNKALAERFRKALSPRPPFILEGLLRGPCGTPMTTAIQKFRPREGGFYCFAAKPSGQRRLSEIRANQAVVGALTRFLTSMQRSQGEEVPELIARLGFAQSGRTQAAKEALNELIEWVQISPTAMTVRIRAEGTFGVLATDTELNLAVRLKGNDKYTTLLVEGGPRYPDQAIIRLLGTANGWMEDLTTGRVKTMEAIATRERLSLQHVSNLMELAFLAPDLKQALIEGRNPVALTATSLQKACPLPLSWTAQRRLLGFDPV
jgi:DNA invertase Pin-like site-specific DNA recombinase